jgi:predicted metal-dependent phosphoesterase TrpH
MDHTLFELHTHSDASPDSTSTIHEIVAACEKKGINAIAITDHDVVFDVRRLKGISSHVTVVPGVEISSDDDSHIIGLYVTKPIRSSNMHAIIREIHAQHGLAVLVHPFRRWQGYLSPRIKRDWTESENVLKEIDCVEIYNSKSTPEENADAEKFFGSRHIPVLGGSDAHTVQEIGNVSVRLYCSKRDLKKGLIGAKREIVIDKANRALENISYGLRRHARTVLNAVGIRKGSSSYDSARNTYLGAYRHVKKALGKK